MLLLSNLKGVVDQHFMLSFDIKPTDTHHIDASSTAIWQLQLGTEIEMVILYGSHYMNHI